MPPEQPYFVILAGPNGAGKTSAAVALLRVLHIDEYVNADVIAQGFSMLRADTMAVTAGRLALKRMRQLLDKQISFAFETTLASHTIARLIAQARSRDYRIALIFLALASPALAKARVARRVELGGHHVPEEIIERRFQRGLHNFFEHYWHQVDEWRFYDNSDGSELLAYYNGNVAILSARFNDYEALVYE